jgi:N-acetyl-anhydromuramyl-L-alanine amidase AmpD
MDVEQAFAERSWTDYLSLPTEKTPHDPNIATDVMAFLSQLIAYQYKSAISKYKTAHEILWKVFQDQYNLRTREDKVRLEAQVLDTRKLLTDTIEQHIQKFDDLATKLLNHQPTTEDTMTQK